MPAPNPIKVPPQRTPLFDDGQDRPDGEDSPRSRDGVFSGALKGRIFSKVWWKFFQDVVNWITYLSTGGAASTVSLSYIPPTLSSGANSITYADPASEGDTLGIAIKQNSGGTGTITFGSNLVGADVNYVTNGADLYAIYEFRAYDFSGTLKWVCVAPANAEQTL